MPKKQDKPPADQVLDGEAVEKTATNASPPVRNKGLGRLAMTGSALLILMGAAAFYYYHNHYTAALTATEMVSGLDGKITAQTMQIAALEQRLSSLGQAHGNLNNAFETSRTRAAANSGTSDTGTAISALAAQIDALMARVQLVEQDVTKIAGQMAGQIGEPSAGKIEPGAASSVMMETDLLLAQTKVAVVSAVLSENAGGGQLAHWAPVIDGLAVDGEPLSGWPELRVLFMTTPPSRAVIMADGRRFVTPMVNQTHDNASNGTFVEQAASRLAKLVQLRPVDQARDDVTGHLARFEAALAVGDLAAATDLADGWPGPVIDGLDDWQNIAHSRLALDQGLVGALVESLDRLTALAKIDVGETQ